MSNEKYLLKIVSKQEHVDTIKDGDLYMHTARYYRNHYGELEDGQADKGEGRVFPGVEMFKGGNYPIYCLYSVEGKSIIEDSFRISRELISSFGALQGYAVLLDYKSFIDKLDCLKTGENVRYSIRAGRVEYGVPSRDCSMSMMTSRDGKALFIKDTKFEQQKEFRVVVFRGFTEEDTCHEPWENKRPCFIDCDTAVFRIEGGLSDTIVKEYQMDQLETIGDKLVFKV